MKILNLFQIALMCVSILIFISCGGGNSVKSNEFFGDIPVIMSEAAQVDKELDEINNSEGDVTEKMLNKMTALETQFEELEESSEEKVKEYFESNNFAGKDIPFETSADVKDHEIKSIKIDKVDGYGVKLSVDFDFFNPSEKFLKNYENYKLYFKAVDKDGNVLLVEDATYNVNRKPQYKKGEISTAYISIPYLSMSKLGDFAKFVSISTDEFKSINN
jgi:hypothetical protein